MDIKKQHPTKQIMTKCSGRNIVTTLCGIDISKAEEGRNDDDDDDNDILDEVIKAPMTMTTMNFNPNIQFFPLIILLGHESQGLHNHMH